MNDVNIKIEIKDKSLVGISGRDFGKQVYNDCIKDKLNFDIEQRYILVIPDQVEVIARSFVLGLIEGVFDYIAFDKFYDYFDISGKNDSAVEDFKDGVGIKYV